mmetsp:Transcript_19681/g.41280  ORF Transcript_19681/g.41280 Transcript_19681/m.41280 type:complete len:1475 (-) Transcript_19681:335-4759(-)
MKRPLCLIGTSLAIMTRMAAPISPGGAHDAVDAAATLEQFIVPVPPVVDDNIEDQWAHHSHQSLRRSTTTTTTTREAHSRASNITHHPHALPQRHLYHATTGTFKNLVLLLRFSDHANRVLPTQSDISRLYNSEDHFIPTNKYLAEASSGKDGGRGKGEDDDIDDIVPSGSVRQVYLQNSYGTFTIETTVIDWITLKHTESYYASGNHGFSKFKTAIIEALNILDDNPKKYFKLHGGTLKRKYDREFDFSKFDVDENGALDGLGILHSGYGAEFGGTDCNGAINEKRIWSHKGGLEWVSNRHTDTTEDDVRVHRYYVSSALRGKCHANIVRMGVICHELGHYLGLPDLYDGTFKGTGLGAYDFMSQSWGWDGGGIYPPNLSAWTRLDVGWARATVIDKDGTYELGASTISNVVYKITAGYPEGEYLLLENRQPYGYDSKIEQGGIAIYHVDENASGQTRRGYPSQEDDHEDDGQLSWPENGNHYKVSLLAADGNYDLERGTNQGDDGDLWHAGSKLTELLPNGGDKGNFPNTDAYQNGHVRSTGIRISGFSESGIVMTFLVEGLRQEAVSLDSMFATSKPTTLEPTSKPVTQPPTTIEPTSSPSTSKPSQQPSYAPVTPRPTSPPTTAPPKKMSITPEPMCGNLCVSPLPSGKCPPDPYALPNCLNVPIGALCDADGECETDQYLNNCMNYDVYQRVECGATYTTARNPAATMVTSTTTTTATTTGTANSASDDVSGEAQQLCSNLCTVPLHPRECPSNPYDLSDCLNVPIGSLCDADGECDTNTYLNNCLTYDVYRRVECGAASSSAIDDSSTDTSNPATTDTSLNMANFHSAAASSAQAWADPGDASVSHQKDAAIDGMTNWNTPFIVTQPTEDKEIVTVTAATGSPTYSPTEFLQDDPILTSIATSRPTDPSTKFLSRLPSNQTTLPTKKLPTKAPSRSPSVKPTMLIITGSSSHKPDVKPFTGVDTTRLDSASHDEVNSCPYYPGWILGVSHCLKDCHQPPYMYSNSIFEFDTLEECCDLHYQGKQSCRAQTLLALEEMSSDEGVSGVLGSVGGQVWKDVNGNHWQDPNERRMGNGVPGVVVGLYECPSSTASNNPLMVRNSVKSTLTSLDGSYLLQEILPGRYYVQVALPERYHLSTDITGWDRVFDSDFDGEGKSQCLDLTGGKEIILNAGLIPNSPVDGLPDSNQADTNTELVSSPWNDETEIEDEMTDLSPVLEDNSSSEVEQNDRDEDVLIDVASYSAMHTKKRISNNRKGHPVSKNAQPRGITSPSSAVHTKSFLRGSSSSYSDTDYALTGTSSDVSTTMIAISPTDDATIHSNEDIRFVGGLGELLVGPQSSWQNNILLKFDVTLSALTRQRDYRAASRAVLRLYSLKSCPSGGVIHYASSNSWDEEHVTWSTAPDAEYVVATIGQTRPHSWVDVDVTGLLLTDTGAATLRITPERSNHSWGAKYSSKENKEGHPAPELRVFF